jgi:hypothetical protein
MKNLTFLIVLLFFLHGIFGCKREKENYQLITIKVNGPEQIHSERKAPSFAMNYSHSQMFYFLGDQNNEITLPVVEHDVLVISNDINGDFYALYEYNIEDGKNLNFTFDTSNVTLNGKPYLVYLNEEQEVLNFVDSLSDEDIRQLRILILEFDSIPGDLSRIDRIARLNPSIGIMADGQTLRLIPGRFSPSLLYCNPGKAIEMFREISSIESIQTLILQDADMDQLNEILKLPHLRQLNVAEQIALQKDVNLSRCPSLEILNLDIDSYQLNVNNLGFIENLKGLKQLNLIVNDSMMDISLLSKFPKLISLNLGGDHLSLDSFPDIPLLKGINFHNNVSQEEFERFVRKHTALVKVGLVYGDKITDLSCLVSMPHLRFLILSAIETDLDANMFKGLENLEYLSIGPIDEKDTTLLKEIKTVLPNTIINENTGFCLGSGYLLLVIPLFLLITVILFLYRSKFSPHRIR